MSDPQVTVDFDGTVSFNWDGSPDETVEMSTTLVMGWVEATNRAVETIKMQQRALTAAQDQLERQQALLTILRLGRRPNESDWASVGLLGGR